MDSIEQRYKWLTDRLTAELKNKIVVCVTDFGMTMGVGYTVYNDDKQNGHVFNIEYIDKYGAIVSLNELNDDAKEKRVLEIINTFKGLHT